MRPHQFLALFAPFALTAAPFHSPLAAQSTIIVPGWADPAFAGRGSSAPISGGTAFAAGRPLLGHALSTAHMVGFDLMVRGMFRYHDHAGRTVGRSAAVSLTGVALQLAAIATERATAASITRAANDQRVRDAAARADHRRAAGDTLTGIPGLDDRDSVRIRVGETGAIRAVAARDVTWRAGLRV